MRRSYGTGTLFVRPDKTGRQTWYGSWWAGGRRVKRRLGVNRSRSCPEGLTRAMAEAELKRLMTVDQKLARGEGPPTAHRGLDATKVAADARSAQVAARTIAEVGVAYVDHL